MFKVENTITLGNLLGILTVLGTAATVYASVISKDVQHDERIAVNAEAVKEIKEELKEVNKTLTAININIARYMDKQKEQPQSQQGNERAFSRPNTR